MPAPRLVPLVLLAAAWGCIPYTAGGTAQPEAPRGVVPYSGLTWVPVGDIVPTDSTSGGASPSGSLLLPRVGWRVGLDSASEVRVELPGLLGAVFGYKRRIAGAADASTWAAALSGSLGWVNFGDHFFLGATAYLSGPERGRQAVPYLGLRFMHVLPRWESAVEDEPVLGAFFGVRLGEGGLQVSPELGVYYDESALGIRNNRIILVPGLTIRGLGFGSHTGR